MLFSFSSYEDNDRLFGVVTQEYFRYGQAIYSEWLVDVCQIALETTVYIYIYRGSAHQNERLQEFWNAFIERNRCGELLWKNK